MKIELDFNEELIVTRWDAKIVIPRTGGASETRVEVSSRQQGHYVFDKRYLLDEGMDDPDMIIVSVRKETPQEKAAVVPEDKRIKHIVSQLVSFAKEDRKNARNRPERSKNKAILEAMANVLDAMASMIESGEMFRNMPVDIESNQS